LNRTRSVLAQQASVRAFDAGAIIFLAGAACDGMWLVEHGSVKISRVNLDGVEHILHLLGPGATFNEIAALDGGPNPATATALSAVTAWMLPSEALRAELHTNRELALAVIGVLTGRVRTLVQQIEDLALYSVAIRLARFLLKQADNPASSGPGVTRAAIAAHLATTPESVSRRCARWSSRARSLDRRASSSCAPLLQAIAQL
jgi:CRP/FNR family transcriptional regulator